MVHIFVSCLLRYRKYPFKTRPDYIRDVYLSKVLVVVIGLLKENGRIEMVFFRNLEN